MKVLLVALNAKYIHSNLAVHVLNKYANAHVKFNGELKVCEYTINRNLDSILQLLYSEAADVIAFSCYIWNINEVLTLSKDLKKISPNTQIWLGGPEVSYDSELVLENNSFVDGVMRGEGEATFSELLETWDNVEFSLDEVDGITFKNFAGKIISTTDRTPISLDEIPFIYENFYAFENRIIYYESSRGCPFSCSYCLSSIDKHVRFRSLDLVEKELQVFLAAKVPQVKFIDRTFNCDKERAYRIWQFITDNDNGVTNFHFEISADLLSSEDIALFAKMRPGLIQLEIGLQSTNPKTIKEIHRTMDIATVKENLLAIHELKNIHQHLDLIAGLPYEDLDSFKQSFCDAYAMKPDQLQLGFLKVLKGSYMAEKAIEYGITFHDEPPYEVMSTKWISYDEIIELKLVEEMVEVYHNSGKFKKELSQLLPSFGNAYKFFSELGEYYKANNLLGIGLKESARHDILSDFKQAHENRLELHS